MVNFQIASLIAIATLTVGAPSADGQRRLLGNSFGAPGNASFEYVVVGAGNAGLPLASRLAEGGHTVALIEGGSFYEIGNSNYSQIPLLGPSFTGKDVADRSPQVDWGFQTVPQRVSLNNLPVHQLADLASGTTWAPVLLSPGKDFWGKFCSKLHGISPRYERLLSTMG